RPKTAVVSRGASPHQHGDSEKKKPSSSNPIFRATSADFRALWLEQLRSSNGKGSRGPSINLFVDWCAKDPEGAVLGLQHIWVPNFQHNYLLNAVHGPSAASLAEPLVAHWEKLDHLNKDDINFALSRSLNALTKEDPDHALALLRSLPSEIRIDVDHDFFDGLKKSTLVSIMEKTATMEEVFPNERSLMWGGMLRSVSKTTSVTEMLSMAPLMKDADVERSLIKTIIGKASRFNQWGQVLADESISNPESSLRKILVENLVSGYEMRRDYMLVVLACEKEGDWSLLGELPTPKIQTSIIAQVSVTPYLEKLTDENAHGGDVSTRVLAKLALNANRYATAKWLEEQEPSRNRDLARVEYIKMMAQSTRPEDIKLVQAQLSKVEDLTLQAEAKAAINQ
ncbi:MAG: hypothetical protein ACPG6P_13370, partial [Akkermansiaceae bacterium]